VVSAPSALTSTGRATGGNSNKRPRAADRAAGSGPALQAGPGRAGRSPAPFDGAVEVGEGSVVEREHLPAGPGAVVGGGTGADELGEALRIGRVLERAVELRPAGLAHHADRILPARLAELDRADELARLRAQVRIAVRLRRHAGHEMRAGSVRVEELGQGTLGHGWSLAFGCNEADPIWFLLCAVTTRV